jgi:hypothetical protein
MRPFGIVQLERADERLQDAVRDPIDVPALDLGVIVGADPGEHR